jgi:hypothetical protein
MFIINEYSDYLENRAADRFQRAESFKSKIASFCDQVEELMNDWPLVRAIPSSFEIPRQARC